MASFHPVFIFLLCRFLIRHWLIVNRHTPSGHALMVIGAEPDGTYANHNTPSIKGTAANFASDILPILGESSNERRNGNESSIYTLLEPAKMLRE